MGSPGICKALDHGICHFQRTSVSTNAASSALHVIVGTICCRTKGSLCLAVPDLFVKFLCQTLKAACAVIICIIVVSYNIHCVTQFFIGSELRTAGGNSYLIRHDNLNLMEQLFLSITEAADRSIIAYHSLCVILHPLIKLLDPFRIILLFVNSRADNVNHVSVLTVSCNRGILQPFINIVPVASHPSRSAPVQQADLHIRVDLLCICCQLKTSYTVYIRIFVLITHSTRLRAGRSIFVISHLNFNVLHNGMLSTKKHLQHFPVLFWMLSLVVQKKRIGAVAV